LPAPVIALYRYLMTVLQEPPGSEFDVLDDPPVEFIEEMRRRYPTERETDELLVRKLRRRGGPPYRPVTLNELCDGLRRMLATTLPGEFEVRNARWAAGGASKIQMAFELRWDDPERGQTMDRMMLRMDPAESHNATSKLREFELLRAFADVVPVPRVYWVDNEATFFPEPVLIYEFVDGVTKPKRTLTGQVSGMGTNFGPELRVELAAQYLSHLAAIHTFDFSDAHFTTLDEPALGTTDAALWQLNRARRLWEEDRGEDLPLMEVAANWLERNLPSLDHVSVVHGDYRSGNFLFDEDTRRITAWLDWERGHLGDRHRDLAWIMQPTNGHYAEDGKTYLVCGLLPLDSFYEDYERASGFSVDPDRMTWYRILNAYSIIVSTLGTAQRVARLGKTHQDILLARVEGVAPPVCAELRALLEEVLR
jgi:aminoglycoside phosphotransferase (APT) family kinase protein